MNHWYWFNRRWSACKMDYFEEKMHLWGASKALVGLLTCNWWFLISNHWSLTIIVKILIRVTGTIIQKSLNSVELGALVWKHTVGTFPWFSKPRPTNAAAVAKNTKHIRLLSSSWNIKGYLDFEAGEKSIWNWTLTNISGGGSEVRSGVACYWTFPSISASTVYLLICTTARRLIKTFVPTLILIPTFGGFCRTFFLSLTSDLFPLGNSKLYC